MRIPASASLLLPLLMAGAAHANEESYSGLGQGGRQSADGGRRGGTPERSQRIRDRRGRVRRRKRSLIGRHRFELEFSGLPVDGKHQERAEFRARPAARLHGAFHFTTVANGPFATWTPDSSAWYRYSRRSITATATYGGTEFAARYKTSDLTVYANFTVGKNWQQSVVTGQFNFPAAELAYINAHPVRHGHISILAAAAEGLLGAAASFAIAIWDMPAEGFE